MQCLEKEKNGKQILLTLGSYGSCFLCLPCDNRNKTYAFFYFNLGLEFYGVNPYENINRYQYIDLSIKSTKLKINYICALHLHPSPLL